MTLLDIAPMLFLRIGLSKGTDLKAIKGMIALFEKLELKLINQKYLSGNQISMCDYYGFPHISRIFYMKESQLSEVFVQMKIEEKFPHFYGWFIRIRNDPRL